MRNLRMTSPEKAEDSPRPTGHRDEADVHIGVKSTEKPSRRPHDDSEKSDDHGNSFEATIDGIDRPAPQNAAAAAGQTADWNAMLAFGQVILDRSQKSSSGKSDGEPASNVGSVPVSAKAPKHESTTALQLARQRLLASDAAANADVAQPTDEEVTSAIIVRSRETHWSFGNTATVAKLTRNNGVVGKFRGGQSAGVVRRDRIGEKRRSRRCNNNVGTHEAGACGKFPSGCSARRAGSTII